MCWEYASRSEKGLLPYNSAHSKVVKRGIAVAAIQNAVVRLCPHTMTRSLENHINRLSQAGYPVSLLFSSAENVLKRVSADTASKRSQEERSKGHLSVTLRAWGITSFDEDWGEGMRADTFFSA